MTQLCRYVTPALALAAALPLAAPGAQAQNLTFETGFERLSDPQTLIEGLNRVYVGHQVTPNFSLGQGFYSAAQGDAGGAFFWGFEGVARLPLSKGFSLSASGFVGGGGGAAQVIGDGTMLRAGLALDYQVSDAWALQLTTAYVDIDGAPISGPTFGIGLRRQIGDGTQGSWQPELAAAGGTVTAYASPSSVRTRAGGAQPRMVLVGAKALFGLGRTRSSALGPQAGSRGRKAICRS